jgi:gliding motility-associated-like protein
MRVYGFKYGFLLVLSMLLFTVSWATHNRAGEIIYRRVNANPFLYEISIITYTKTGGPSDAADRCELELFFGDETSEVVDRVNGPLNQGCDPGVGIGVKIAPSTRYNVYTTTHEFPGAGTYRLSMEDPMRNGGVVNIENSDNVPFYIESFLTIDIATGGNQAPVLQNPPIDNGCVGVPFYHNPGAVDPEGDSLVYSIVSSRSYDGEAITNYLFPDEVSPGPNNQLTIDPLTGTLSWDAPQLAGEYNVAILIEEYRTNTNSGAVFKVGSIMRDMQIDIGNCPPNDPPFITLQEEVCVTAGQTLVERITATDPEGGNLRLSAVGFPLDAGNGGSIQEGDSVTGLSPVSMTFRWNTNCSQVRRSPYWMYFKAKELSGMNADLVDFKTMAIEVVSPAVRITNIEPKGTSLIIDWTQAVCNEATGYDVYRFNDSLGYEAPECLTGVPEALGYEYIGSTEGLSNTRFVDDDAGEGLVHGQRYCYMIVTRFRDGSESYPSEESCGLLIRDVPILNQVSVAVTDSLNGEIEVAWYKPIELNTAVYGPPYRYQLSRSTDRTGDFDVVYTSDAATDPFELDTTYADRGLNTLRNQYFYRITMLSGSDQTSVGASRSASSIFLRSEPSDNTLSLSWDVNVPWTNQAYVVYRFVNADDTTNTTIVLDTVTGTSYVDEGLANLVAYRYVVQSIGAYSALDLSDTLYNLSQRHTGIPIDNEPPCAPPDRIIEGDCDLEQTVITWSNPNENCEDVDDVVSYRIYYAPFLGDPVQVLQEIDDPNVTEYVHNANGSIAGCYAITAIDSFANESDMDEPLCVDNCPLYELPNVFTPGDDGRNDFFTPFPYKFVESVNLSIYNRWGTEVFQTNDPDVNWDGTDQRSGRPLPSGVYYYICIVNEIRLTGIEPREIKGSLHLLNEQEDQQLAP